MSTRKFDTIKLELSNYFENYLYMDTDIFLVDEIKKYLNEEQRKLFFNKLAKNIDKETYR